MFLFHFKENPLFLYVSYTAAHSPLQPDPEYEAKCLHIPHLWRRQFCGLVVGLDAGIGRITKAAKENLGDDTVIVVSSDNGGSTLFGGLNQPTTIVTGFEVQFNFLKKFEILKLKNEKLKILKLKFEILKKRKKSPARQKKSPARQKKFPRDKKNPRDKKCRVIKKNYDDVERELNLKALL